MNSAACRLLQRVDRLLHLRVLADNSDSSPNSSFGRPNDISKHLGVRVLFEDLARSKHIKSPVYQKINKTEQANCVFDSAACTTGASNGNQGLLKKRAATCLRGLVGQKSGCHHCMIPDGLQRGAQSGHRGLHAKFFSR